MERIQLTLFIAEEDAELIEKIRKKFNPEQYALIRSHVTLCREDELIDVGKAVDNLKNIDYHLITISFGYLRRFSDNKGLLISALKENTQFDLLREKVLEGIIAKPRKHEPHITLMHPRNSTCTDAIFEEIMQYAFPQQLTFDKIALIKQENGEKWQTLQTFYLV